jgi:hypothetical protein
MFSNARSYPGSDESLYGVTTYIEAEIRVLPVFGCVPEVHEHARPAGFAKHVGFEFRGKAVLGEIIFAGEKRHVFSLWIYEKIAIFGANGAVAAADVGFSERKKPCLQPDLSAMAAAPVGLELRSHDCVGHEVRRRMSRFMYQLDEGFIEQQSQLTHYRPNAAARGHLQHEPRFSQPRGSSGPVCPQAQSGRMSSSQSSHPDCF